MHWNRPILMSNYQFDGELYDDDGQQYITDVFVNYEVSYEYGWLVCLKWDTRFILCKPWVIWGEDIFWDIYIIRFLDYSIIVNNDPIPPVSSIQMRGRWYLLSLLYRSLKRSLNCSHKVFWLKLRLRSECDCLLMRISILPFVASIVWPVFLFYLKIYKLI